MYQEARKLTLELGLYTREMSKYLFSAPTRAAFKLMRSANTTLLATSVRLVSMVL